MDASASPRSAPVERGLDWARLDAAAPDYDGSLIEASRQLIERSAALREQSRELREQSQRLRAKVE
jgi:hypothetical protein